MSNGTAADRLVFDTNAERFATEVLERSRTITVGVDFWAAWCGPCRALAPLLDQLVEQYDGRLAVARVNIDEEPAIAAQFGIRSIPDVRIFKDGRMVDGFIGVQPLARLRALFDRHVARPSEDDRRNARARLEAGDAAGAATLLGDIVTRDPANTPARIDLAEALARLGDGEGAEAALAQLPVNESTGPAVDAVRARLHFLKSAPEPAQADGLRQPASEAKPPLDIVHRLAAHEILHGDAQRALSLLLSIMERDRRFGDDLGRRSLLHAFALLGEDDERVKEYRRRMARLLY